MFLTLLLFFIGFYILIKGANVLVDGASSIARKFGISNLVIGLVIIGIGTSIPEFSISFLANTIGNADIGLGTIIGSNTFNILFILGLSAFLFPLRLKAIWVKRDLIWNIAAVFAAAALMFLNGEDFIGLTKLEGFILFGIFVFWLYSTIKESNGRKDQADNDNTEPARLFTVPMAFFLMFAGFIGVILGGKWVVDGGVVIAKEIGMSEALIGLTIIGIGTSLPELAVSVTAAYKKQPGIAVGNIIGSNIFDFLMIIGLSAAVKPIAFPKEFFIDIIITLFSAVLLFAAMFTGERYTLKRWEGFLFIIFYIMYFGYLIMRG